MAGYIGSKAAVTQVDGYTKSEADDRYVNDTGDTITFTSNEGDALLIEQADGTDVGSLRINNGSFILKGKHSTNPVQIQTHDGNEDIEVDPDGFIKFETGGGERMRLTNDGLTVNGDTAAANALDDYEEGTWTPATPSGSWSVQDAKYVKVGRLVTCFFNIDITSTVSSSEFTGLPFTPSQEAAGIVGYQNHISGEVMAVYVQAANIWNLRIGSTQYGMGSGKTLRGSFMYPTNS